MKGLYTGRSIWQANFLFAFKLWHVQRNHVTVCMASLSCRRVAVRSTTWPARL